MAKPGKCTRCKQDESYPRHKWMGGVFCETCIRWIRGFRPASRGRSWLGSLWERVSVFLGRVLNPRTKHIDMDKERAIQTQMKVQKAVARDIPYNPQGGGPGKH